MDRSYSDLLISRNIRSRSMPAELICTLTNREVGGGDITWWQHCTVQRTFSLAYLGAKIRTGERPCLVVWNPLSWERGGMVRAPAPESKSFARRDAISGRSVPYELTRKESDEMEQLFAADPVPGTG